MKLLRYLKNTDIRNFIMLLFLCLVILLILHNANKEAERLAREYPYGTPIPEITLPVPPRGDEEAGI